MDAIGATGIEEGDAARAFGRRSRLDDSDPPRPRPIDKSARDKEIEVGLKEAARAELQNGKRHGSDLDQRFDDAAGWVEPVLKHARRVVERSAMGGERPGRERTGAQRGEHLVEVCPRRVAAAERRRFAFMELWIGEDEDNIAQREADQRVAAAMATKAKPAQSNTQSKTSPPVCAASRSRAPSRSGAPGAATGAARSTRASLRGLGQRRALTIVIRFVVAQSKLAC